MQPQGAVENQGTLNMTTQPNTVEWQASEFIEHQKSSQWFVAFGIGTLVMGVLVFFITQHSIFSTVVVVLAAITFAMYAHQKPRTLKYRLGASSITIGDKQYKYDDFRTFSVMQEGMLQSIVLQPLKRFMPPLTLYFANEDGEKIFDVLAKHIPHEERRPDPIDNLMRRIRF